MDVDGEDVTTDFPMVGAAERVSTHHLRRTVLRVTPAHAYRYYHQVRYLPRPAPRLRFSTPSGKAWVNFMSKNPAILVRFLIAEENV